MRDQFPPWWEKFITERRAGKTIGAATNLAGIHRSVLYRFCARHPAAHAERLKADREAIDRELARRRREWS
jgi:hypothetical protein